MGDCERGTSSENHDESVVTKHYDWEEISPTTAIVETVAAATGQDMLTMDPLEEQVPTDPLDSFFQAPRDRDGNKNRSVTVRYLNHQITLYNDGQIIVREMASVR